MSGKDIKLGMKKKVRTAAGLVNLLRDDIDCLRTDVNDFDILCLGETIKDTKSTLQMLLDNVMEIEYLLYLFNSKDSHGL